MKNFEIENSPKIKSGFKVPDDYFDQLSENIFQRIQEDDKPVISIFRKYYQAVIGIAAVIIVGLLITFNTSNSQEINQTELENYFAYHSNMNQYDLADILNEDDIDNIDIDYNLESDEVADYLDSHSNVQLLMNN